MIPSLPWRWSPFSRRRGRSEHLAIQAGAHRLAWVHTDAQGRVLRAGCEDVAIDDSAALARRLRAHGLPTQGVTALLALDEAQLLQIEAPAVKPEELKSAARWRIKDLVDARLEELTIDVMEVGQARAREAARQIFVAAARNALIQKLSRSMQAAGLTLAVIDITETAQRNLQHAAARAEGLAARATALLMRHGERALLTVCAGGELYDARALDWEAATATDGAASAPTAPLEELDFVDYGAVDAPAGEVPRLVVEVQRSLDVWERTWPDLPVARLWVHADEGEAALVAQLEAAIGLGVRSLAPQRLFEGLGAMAGEPAVQAAALPLVGALQRHLD